MNNIKILVATHKKYKMPESSMYLPIHVGKEGKNDLGYIGDNTGDNISTKNSNYCELTAMYWAWKNLDSEYIGLCHYRRYFTTKNNIQIKLSKNIFENILNEDEAIDMLKRYDIVVSKKKKLFLKTVQQKYAQQHFEKDIVKCGSIISKKYPDYMGDFDDVMRSKEMSICNMFICSNELLKDYSEWLFSILFELEKQIDISEYSVLQKRIYGFLSERLFNVWLKHNSKLKIGYLKILNIEHDSPKTVFAKAKKRILRIKS